MSNPIELPSLEEINEMDRQRLQAIEALEISEDSSSVKCQKCGNAVPIVGKLMRKSSRITALQTHLMWAEQHHRYLSRLNHLNSPLPS